MTGSVSDSEITFPQVTKQITIMNRDSSDDIYVYFSGSAQMQTNSRYCGEINHLMLSNKIFKLKCNTGLFTLRFIDPY